MSYKNWTDEELIYNGTRLKILIPWAKYYTSIEKDTVKALFWTIEIERAELTYTELQNEWKRRQNTL